MRVALVMLLTAWLCLTMTGCALFGKKSNDTARPASASSGGKTPGQPSGNSDPILQGANANNEPNGILAGTVIDGFNQNPRDAYIRYVCLEESKTEDAPIDVAVNPQGYFTIRGVKPGKQYKLIARAKQGEKLISGVTYAKAPNIHVVIRVSESFNNGSTPEVPGSPAYTPKSDDAKKTTLVPPDQRPVQSSWNATTKIPTTAGLVIGTPQPLSTPELPARVSVPPPPPPPSALPPTSEPSAGWVPGIASDKKNWPPMLDIPQGKKSPMQIQKPAPLIDGPPPTSTSPARVPSCVLIGNKLYNLALSDLTGQPWEFRTSRQGKLVLFDFWATYCMPCRDALPQLRDLQARYGPALEVLGIACEDGGTPEEQALRVRGVCVRLQCNYRQLLSAGTNCPVKTQFGVRLLPTLVLVDDTGAILWRHEGLDPSAREDLELLIQRKLGLR